MALRETASVVQIKPLPLAPVQANSNFDLCITSNLHHQQSMLAFMLSVLLRHSVASRVCMLRYGPTILMSCYLVVILWVSEGFKRDRANIIVDEICFEYQNHMNIDARYACSAVSYVAISSPTSHLRLLQNRGEWFIGEHSIRILETSSSLPTASSPRTTINCTEYLVNPTITCKLCDGILTNKYGTIDKAPGIREQVHNRISHVLERAQPP